MNRSKSIYYVLLLLCLVFCFRAAQAVPVNIGGIELEDMTSTLLMGSNDRYSEVKDFCSRQYYFIIKNYQPDSVYLRIDTNSFSSIHYRSDNKYLVTVFYHTPVGTADTIDVTIVTNVSSTTFPKFVSYDCPNTPYPVGEVYPSNMYKYPSFDGSYRLLAKYTNLVKFSVFVLTVVNWNTQVMASVMDENDIIFSISLPMSKDILFSTKDVNSQNTSLIINNLLYTDYNTNSITTKNNLMYPSGCSDLNYYHCYQFFDIEATSPDYLIQVLEVRSYFNFNIKNSMPVFGNPLNATYFGILPHGNSYNVTKWNKDIEKLELVYPNVALNYIASGTTTFLDNDYPKENTLSTPSYNIKIKSPFFNPWMKMTVESYLMDNLNEIAYFPYGIYSGNLTELSSDGMAEPLIVGLLYNMDVPFFSTNSYAQFYWENSVDFYYNRKSFLIDINPTTSDTWTPIILWVKFIHLENNMVALQVRASDQGSGVQHFLLYSGGIVVDIRHLKQGDMYDGVYEIILPSRYWSNAYYSNDIMIYDHFGNTDTYSQGRVLNPDFDFFPGNPYALNKYYITIDNVIDIGFEKNDVDLTYNSVNNSLIIKLDPPRPEMTMTLQASFKIHLTNYLLQRPELPVDTDFYSYFDIDTQSHIINFTLPSRLFTGILSYNLLPFGLDHTVMGQWNPKAELRVFSQNADIFPPVISNIVRYPSPLATIGQDSIIGFEITIEDSLNGFKEGYAVVSSEIDVFGYNFSLKASADNPNNVFQLYFPLDPKTRPQNYTISQVYLVDNSGHHSLTPSLLDISPLMRFLGDYETNTLLTQYVNPLTLNDTQTPVLNSFSIVSNQTNVIGESTIRTLVFEYEITDDDSGVSTTRLPIVYLTNAKFQVIASTTAVNTVDTDSKRVVFQSTVSYDMLFAFNNYPLISIYGVFDRHMNLIGFTSTDLSDRAFIFNIDMYLPTFNPIIKNITLDKNNNRISIHGSCLGVIQSKDLLIEVLEPSTNVSINSISSFIYQNSTLIEINSNLIPISGVLRINSFNLLSSEFTYDFQEPEESSSSSVDNLGSSFEVKKVCNTDKECNGSENGVCINNVCHCIYPAFGLNCFDKVIQDGKKDINTTEPTIIISQETTGDKTYLKALISIVKVIEFDSNKNNVFEYNFNQWQFSESTKSNGNQVFSYQANITKDSSNTAINVDIESFINSETITFANQQLEMIPNSNKYSIKLNSYPFSKSTNYLQLVMSVSIEGEDNKDSCSFKESGDIVTNNYSEFFKVQINDKTLYGRFIKRGIIDSKVVMVSNELSNSFSSDDNSFSTQSYIGMNIPFFWETVLLDPDFSLLLDSKPASKDMENSICSTSSKNKLGTNQIIGIALGCFGFVAVAVIATVYYFKKRKESMKLRSMLESKLQSISN